MLGGIKYPKVIYAIRHNITGRVYVGSTTDLKVRYATHIRDLKRGKHNSKIMQQDFDVYGENFTVYRLGEIKNCDESYKEYDLMRELKTYDEKHGYNQGDIRKMNKVKIPLSDKNLIFDTSKGSIVEVNDTR